MDPAYAKYLSSFGVNPTQYIEMQANYLRLLANCYSNPEKPKSPPLVQREETQELVANNEILRTEENHEAYALESKDEPAYFQKSLNTHDEIPIKSLAIPFEKLLEEELKKNSQVPEPQKEKNSKHEYLKRKTETKSAKNLKENKKWEKKWEKPFQSSEKIEFSKIEENFTVHMKPDLLTKSLSSLEGTSEIRKQKQIFLKRGEGKLCTKQRSSSVAKQNEFEKNKLRHSDSLNENSKESVSEEENQPVTKKIPKKSEKISKLGKELEKKKSKFEQDALEFYKMRELEVRNLEIWKADEMKIIAEEKKNLEKLFANTQNGDFEVENLKKEIGKLKKTIQKNEEKYNKAINDLKDIIETLTIRNKELESLLTTNSRVSENTEKTKNSQQFEDVENLENLKKFEKFEKFEKLEKLEIIEEKSLSQHKKQNNPQIKNSPNKFSKEETPKFKKIETIKEPPTFTFKLPDKKTIGNKAKGKDLKSQNQAIFPPVIEINLDESKEEKGIQEIVEEGKTSKIYEDGKREIKFSNGVRKEIFPDGYVIVHFNNKDRKESFPDGKIIYHFFENKTVQTTFPDGLQLFQFSNGQTEKHFSDGTKEIKFPDGTIKCIFNDGEEESIFPDGTVQKIDTNGIKTIEFVNGMKDIINPDGTKTRQYPDGKIKKKSPNGKVSEN